MIEVTHRYSGMNDLRTILHVSASIQGALFHNFAIPQAKLILIRELFLASSTGA
jgi:hypothetical protein